VKNIYVDGYNVISSWQELREAKEGSLGAAREMLIEILQNYSTYKGYKLFLVFDAHLQRGSLEKKEKVNNHLIVIYTKEGQTADSYIEKAVNNVGRKIDVTVVTSDSLEQQLAFQRGATRMSSIEFYFEVMKTQECIRKQTEKKCVDKRNLLLDRLDKDILEQLEKIRKS